MQQTQTRFDRRVDLLAIDASGVIYIIELKVAEAEPGTVAQVLGYLHWIKQLSREEIIRDVAAGRLKIDLLVAFQRHFGHPLPDAINTSQVLVFIAGSIHPTAAGGILALKGLGCTITTLRYIIQHEAVSFIPAPADKTARDPPPAPDRPSPGRPRPVALSPASNAHPSRTGGKS